MKQTLTCGRCGKEFQKKKWKAAQKAATPRCRPCQVQVAAEAKALAETEEHARLAAAALAEAEREAAEATAQATLEAAEAHAKAVARALPQRTKKVRRPRLVAPPMQLARLQFLVCCPSSAGIDLDSPLCTSRMRPERANARSAGSLPPTRR